MTRTDMIKEIAKKTGYAQREISVILETAQEVFKEQLTLDNPIKIREFGTFYLKQYKEKTIVNPKTNISMEIPSKLVLKFSPAREFKKEIALATSTQEIALATSTQEIALAKRN